MFTKRVAGKQPFFGMSTYKRVKMCLFKRLLVDRSRYVVFILSLEIVKSPIIFRGNSFVTQQYVFPNNSSLYRKESFAKKSFKSCSIFPFPQEKLSHAFLSSSVKGFIMHCSTNTNVAFFITIGNLSLIVILCSILPCAQQRVLV